MKRWGPLLALSAGCLSTAGNESAAGACADYASAICNLYQSCSDGWAITLDFGDLATCVSQFAGNCKARLAAPNGQPPDRIESCAQALADFSCANLYARLLPEICDAPAGPEEIGAACAVDAECQSALCIVYGSGPCGVCGSPTWLAVDCNDNGDCASGKVCFSTNATCGAQSGDGGPCSDDNDCVLGLGCLFNAGSGRCAPSGVRGSPCDQNGETGLACPNRLGLFCKPSAAGTASCEPFGQADAGQACNHSAAVATVCIRGGVCETQPSLPVGVCLGAGSVGQPCNIQSGPWCLPELHCVVIGDQGTAGTCQFPASASCD